MTHGEGTPRYVVRAADLPAERSTIEHLFASGFPDTAEPTFHARLAQHYLENPAGPAACLVLEVGDTGEPVGMQGLLRRRFRSEVGSVRGAAMADYLVLPAHRTLGPALQLLRAALEAGQRHADFLYGFPNKRAGVVFARAGLGPRAMLTRYAHLIRSEASIRRTLSPTYQGIARVVAVLTDLALAVRHRLSYRWGWPTLTWSEPETFGAEVDEIWSRFAPTGLVTGERTAQVLKWRFQSNRSPRILVAHHAVDRSPVGYVVWSLSGRGIEIHDVLCVRPDLDLTPLLVGFVARARRTAAEVVSFEFAGPPALRSAVQRAGFAAREQSPVHLSVAGDNRHADDLAASLYLTSFDRDTD